MAGSKECSKANDSKAAKVPFAVRSITVLDPVTGQPVTNISSEQGDKIAMQVVKMLAELNQATAE